VPGLLLALLRLSLLLLLLHVRLLALLLLLVLLLLEHVRLLLLHGRIKSINVLYRLHLKRKTASAIAAVRTNCGCAVLIHL
jgi:hypothetical protein